MNVKPNQRRAFNSAHEKCQAVRPDLPQLRALAQQFPEFQSQVEELESMCEHTTALTTLGRAYAGES